MATSVNDIKWPPQTTTTTILPLHSCGAALQIELKIVAGASKRLQFNQPTCQNDIKVYGHKL